MKTLCHRGLDLDHNTVESSLDSFNNVLQYCDGLELDLQLSKDGQLFVWHDQRAERLTDGKLKELLSSFDLAEIKSRARLVSPVCVWEDVVQLIRSHPKKLFAIHLKGPNQTEVFLKAFKSAMKAIEDLHSSLMVFDCRREVARDLAGTFSELPLALSVAHEYDILRYNEVTAGTLYSVQECLDCSKFVQWAWLDEWDLKGASGSKRLYTQETVKTLKGKGFNVAVVSPELHATSPGLLGGEAHEEGKDLQRLEELWSELEKLNVDAICSDYCSRISGSY